MAASYFKLQGIDDSTKDRGLAAAQLIKKAAGEEELTGQNLGYCSCLSFRVSSIWIYLAQENRKGTSHRFGVI